MGSRAVSKCSADLDGIDNRRYASTSQREVCAPEATTIRIKAPRSTVELRLREVWMYRELLLFLVWRDLKVRYKQTVIGVAWVVLQLLLALCTALGIGPWLSALNALYRDVKYVTPFLVQFWMLASPVAYPSSLVPAKWTWLYGLNPMAGVIEGFRWALTGYGQAPGALLLASAGAVAVILGGGLIFFQRMEEAVADMV